MIKVLSFKLGTYEKRKMKMKSYFISFIPLYPFLLEVGRKITNYISYNPKSTNV